MPDRQQPPAPEGSGFDFIKSRVLLFDANDRVLLFYTKAQVDTNPTRWVTPGGHVERGESHVEGAARELFEETGLAVTPDALGAPVWSREFSDERLPGVFKTNYEEWFVLRTTNFEPSNAGWTDDEQVDMVASRWWSIDELEQTRDPIEPAGELVTVIRGQLQRLHAGSEAPPRAVRRSSGCAG
ncbi:NUDIX hydrolase [Subtercola sp. YIM 133946]|uniref:NUDIX hydrolase n=1 Tax=Subtercola sp. YIM 133946 TaxID=3118909 RepID=UPI002F94917B